MRKREIAATLRYARKLIVGGWVQGVGHRVVEGKDYYCSVGAISRACADRYNHYARPKAYDAVMKYFRTAGFGSQTASLANWNDAPETTHAVVKDKFMEVIKSTKC